MSEIIQKDEQEAKKDGAQAAQDAVTDKTLFDPEVQLQKFSRGKIRLASPILASDKDVTELIYDFAAALDKGGAVGMNAFRITDTQAFELFAAAAGKATAGIDATDIRERMGAVDSVKAVQLATVFFSAANRAGNRRISNV